MSAPGEPTKVRKVRKRKRRRSKRPPFLTVILVAGLAVGVFFVARWVSDLRPLSSSDSLPDAYDKDIADLKREYAHYYGTPMDDSKVGSRFRSAAELATKRNYAGATSMLESATKAGGAVPVMFHNLGIVYTQLGDLGRAADAFREALARDAEYSPTRKFLTVAKGFLPGAAEPYSSEREPNNDNTAANLIGLRAPVGGDVGASNDSVDYFRAIAPASPRDLVAIEVANHSINFSPRIRVYDANLLVLNWGEGVGKAGESVKVIGGPPPNAPIYIAISSAETNGGLYVLTVTPQKAFDQYEPNDDILSARRISPGEEVSANVMDGQDSDFYSFVSPRKGTVTIELRNRSTTLIPALTTYNTNQRNMGFAQDVHKPGASAQQTVNVDKDQTYFVQVSSQAGTAGAYTLRID